LEDGFLCAQFVRDAVRTCEITAGRLTSTEDRPTVWR